MCAANAASARCGLVCRVYLLLMRPALAPASDAPVIEGTPFNWISNDRIVSVVFAIARERRDVFWRSWSAACNRFCMISFYAEVKLAKASINSFRIF